MTREKDFLRDVKHTVNFIKIHKEDSFEINLKGRGKGYFKKLSWIEKEVFKAIKIY